MTAALSGTSHRATGTAGFPLDDRHRGHRPRYYTSGSYHRPVSDNYIWQHNNTRSYKGIAFDPDASIQFSEVGDDYRPDVYPTPGPQL